MTGVKYCFVDFIVSNWITSDCILGTKRGKFLGVLMESLQCCDRFVEKVILTIAYV